MPEGTAFLLLVGVGVELSLMFSIAGLVMSKFLPADPARKILGVAVDGLLLILFAGILGWI